MENYQSTLDKIRSNDSKYIEELYHDTYDKALNTLRRYNIDYNLKKDIYVSEFSDFILKVINQKEFVLTCKPSTFIIQMLFFRTSKVMNSAYMKRIYKHTHNETKIDIIDVSDIITSNGYTHYNHKNHINNSHKMIIDIIKKGLCENEIKFIESLVEGYTTSEIANKLKFKNTDSVKTKKNKIINKIKDMKIMSSIKKEGIDITEMF